MREIWKDIPGYEGSYQASNLGRIKSLQRVITRFNGETQTINQRILKPRNHVQGYDNIVISLNHKKCNKTVHRWIMTTFCGNSNLHINHINGNKKDNRLVNLEYVTALKNCNHHVRVLKRKKKYGAYPKNNSWVSVINIKGRIIHLGCFENKDQAHNAFYNNYFEFYGKYPW